MGVRYISWHPVRKYIAGACCQRIKRCSLRHVPCDHYVVVISMAASLLFDKTPGLRNISSGFRIIIITLIIAGIAAYFFPVKEDEYDELEEAGELSDSTKEAHHES